MRKGPEKREATLTKEPKSQPRKAVIKNLKKAAKPKKNILWTVESDPRVRAEGKEGGKDEPMSFCGHHGRSP